MSEKNSQWSVWKECWKQRLLYIVAGIIALIGSSIISLSIPSTYHSYKQISIDANKYNILEKGNLSELIKKNKGLEPSTITTDPEIFALIIRSQVFLENLASVQLCFSNGKPNSTYGQHLKEAKQPWWNNLLKKKPYLELIQNNVKCEVNWHNGIITLRVADQDAFVAFQMVDSVSQRLQGELYKYLKSKSIIDLKNRDKERLSAKRNYTQAQQRYVNYAEQHFGNQTPSQKIEQESLEKEASRALTEYNDALQQYNITKMNYEKIRPNFIDLKTNVLPLSPSHPRWTANFFLWLFYCWVFTTWFVLLRKQYQFKQHQDGKRQ